MSFLRLRLVFSFASIITFASILLPSIAAQAQTTGNLAVVPAEPNAPDANSPPGLQDMRGTLVPYDQAMKNMKARKTPPLLDVTPYLSTQPADPAPTPLSATAYDNILRKIKEPKKQLITEPVSRPASVIAPASKALSAVDGNNGVEDEATQNNRRPE